MASPQTQTFTALVLLALVPSVCAWSFSTIGPLVTPRALRSNAHFSRARWSQRSKPGRVEARRLLSSMSFPSFMPEEEMALVEDLDCIAMAKRLNRLATRNVPVEVSEEGCVLTSCVGPSFEIGKPVEVKGTPLVCLHGFDSSCLEYRRLLPLLEGEAS